MGSELFEEIYRDEMIGFISNMASSGNLFWRVTRTTSQACLQKAESPYWVCGAEGRE